MSAYLYGRLRLQRATDATMSAAASEDNKFLSAVAGLVPTEVIGLHALFLARWTTTDNAGVTSITDPTLLGYSLVPCLLFGPALYWFGRKGTQWQRKDTIALLMPALAFLVWAALIGTSALTPLVAGRVDATVLWGVAIVSAAVLLLVNKAVN